MSHVRSSLARVARRIPGAIRLRRLVGRVEHRLRLRFAQRQNMLYTEFRRAPTQLGVVAGPVVDFLGVSPFDSQRELRIVVFGCSTGAEPYSIASTLRRARPWVRARLECFDIEPTVVARAQAARYSAKDVLSANVDTAFLEETFDIQDGEYVVKPGLADTASFAVGSVLDEAFIAGLGSFDIVVAQNFLFHLDRQSAERAFRNLFTLLKPRAALVVDGADLDLRAQLTAAAGLRPVTAELERIHDESRLLRGYAWPSIYWGLEPFDAKRSDAVRRYATIFLREPDVGARVHPRRYRSKQTR